MDEIKRDRILQAFDAMFPDAYCELNHGTHFQLLVAVMLSAQTTDAAVNKITPNLFNKFPDAFSMANADLLAIEDCIKRIGLYKNKAKNVKQMSQILIDQYNGIVPNTREALVALPGVGRKTANVVLSVAFNYPAFAVDTHVERVSKRLNIAKEKDSVKVVEEKVTKFFPIERWNRLHHQMIFFGRYHCTAKKPNCKECPLYEICRYKEKEKYAE
jgi:endonuclease III